MCVCITAQLRFPGPLTPGGCPWQTTFCQLHLPKRQAQVQPPISHTQRFCFPALRQRLFWLLVLTDLNHFSSWNLIPRVRTLSWTGFPVCSHPLRVPSHVPLRRISRQPSAELPCFWQFSVAYWKEQAGGSSLKALALVEVAWQMDFLSTATAISPIHVFLQCDPDTTAIKW